MNYVCCPNCGGRLEAVSIGWICRGKCKGFVDMGGMFHKSRGKSFTPPMTNADRLRKMNDEELSDQLVLEIEGIAPCKMFISIPTGEMFIYRNAAKKSALNWLMKEETED